METKYTYWQNVDMPFFILRQLSFTGFECFNRRTGQWKDYPEGFREVSLNFECREIPEEEALRIVRVLESTDTNGMNSRELRALVQKPKPGR